jgi:hypothetical protein
MLFHGHVCLAVGFAKDAFKVVPVHRFFKSFSWKQNAHFIFPDYQIDGPQW